jgi:hypothetical protein
VFCPKTETSSRRSGFSLVPGSDAAVYSGSCSNGGDSDSSGVVKDPKECLEIEEEEDFGCGIIQLDDCNTVVGRLKCGLKFDVVVDSGATLTLLSTEVVKSSPYLRSLTQIKTEPKRIRIADGSVMVSDRMLQFEVSIQGFVFTLSAQIMPAFGLVKGLLGTEDLKKLSACLDFKTNQLMFNLKPPKPVPFKVKNKVILKPGASKFVTVTGKLAKNCCSGELVLNSSKIGQKLTSSSLLTHVKHGSCLIPIFNDSDKIIRLNRGTVLAYADLEASHYGRYAIDYGCHADSDEDKFRAKLLKKNLRKYPFLDRSDPKASMSEQEILRSEVDLDTDCSLSGEQKSRLGSLLVKHKKSFSLYGEIGSANNHVVKLHLVDETPFFIRPYTVSEDEKVLIDKELDKLVKMGVLEQGVASCSSPVMMIKKKGTTAKRCVSDFRFLNQRIRRQNWPFPLVRDTIQKLGMSGCKVVSTIDLKEAFHSLHLDEKSQQFTGIVSYYGGKSYYYKRLPMGSSISPSEWQYYIEKLLDDIPDCRSFCVAHMDDLICFSQNISEHMQHLDRLLEGISRHGLKISPKKAKFCKSRVEYMGHVISVGEEGPCISAMKSKCDAIRNLRVPSNSKEVRTFIGAVSYLSDYLPNLQILLRPLHKISNKRSHFVWSKECQVNFDQIRSMLCQPPVLMMPRAVGSFILYSDTSRFGTGGTLCQMVDGQERVIGYHSKLLPPAAARYSVSELEYKGLILNVKAFRNILRSVSFYAVVDHSALVEIQKSKREPPTQRFRNFIDELSDYSFTLTYLPGKRLGLSDMLSRMSSDSTDDSERVVPIACHGDALWDAFVVTRSQAQKQGIVLGNPSEYGVQPPTRSSVPNSVPSSVPNSVPSSDNVGATSGSGSSFVPENVCPPVGRDQAVSDRMPTSVMQPVVEDGGPVPTIPSIPVPIHGETRSLVQSQYKSTGGRTDVELPIEALIPRDTSGDDEEDAVPSISRCPDVLTRPNTPLFSYLKPNQVVSGHLPCHNEVRKHLDLIKQKCLRDFDIPLKAAEIKREYQNSGEFSDLYKFLRFGELPSRKKRALNVMHKSESFILIQNLLFRISFHDPVDELSLQLCVPESQGDFIISMFHDSLFAMHQGVVRTYNTIRRKYFIPGLFDRVVIYVRSCTVCQERKVPQARDSHQVHQPRIFAEYKPFGEVHVDIKQMFPATDGSSYLLIATCVQTRYVIGIPVRNIEAVTVAEALLQRLIFQFGLPQRLVTDQGSQFTSKVFSLILRTLGIDQIFVSPHNHGSLVCERSIQTLSNLLLSQLHGKGRQWCYYVQAACHAYNTFAHSTLGGYSPFELVYMRKPPDWLQIDTGLLKNVKVPYGDYVEQLKYRLQLIGSLVLSLHNDAQEKEARKHAASLRKVPTYKVGQLVYFLLPSSGALETNTRKFVVKYVGPVRIKSVLDTTHVLLEDLSGRSITGVHHTNRIKPAYVRGKSGAISNMKELNEELESNFCLENQSKCDGDVVFVCGHEGELVQEAVPHHIDKEIGDDLLCTKSRYKDGSIEVLFTNRINGVVKRGCKEFSEWYDLKLFPGLEGMFHSGSRPKCTGSRIKFKKMLNV